MLEIGAKLFPKVLESLLQEEQPLHDARVGFFHLQIDP